MKMVHNIVYTHLIYQNNEGLHNLSLYHEEVIILNRLIYNTVNSFDQFDPIANWFLLRNDFSIQLIEHQKMGLLVKD
jgi:hypothetical protein